jgi:hypothetical protein
MRHRAMPRLESHYRDPIADCAPAGAHVIESTSRQSASPAIAHTLAQSVFA